ncbi:peptidylprolyl isomerase [Meiothermus sp.]|jgi:peptidyl-prolyl cis-trans isomerase A (cyclophilin A)|uniref:peptidylprolyl isomerase n=1 Tax=Meiothermus sp. TaxID=1955249 RepID=UPI0021DE464C|nr:peptidylprolyl isomerase [Meiothermus sp.]GIW25378.1 MAG: peptidyl-prolyl cis-trans isomerase [Meiothermus sp.]
MEEPNPSVMIQTELGSIELELFLSQAPITVGNFLRYVNEKRYQGATFYRTVRPDNQAHSPVKIEVIQGGLGMGEHPAKLPPIPHETTAQTGLRHLDGTLSMARLEPGSAQSEFFICIGDQPELDFGGGRNPDGQGFAAFGQVVRGMEVVQQIQQQPAAGGMPLEGQWIVEPVKIISIELI